MQLLIFEDDVVADLAPITTARPAYAITCATYRLIDRLAGVGGPVAGAVRRHLRCIQSLDYGIDGPDPATLRSQPVLAVNARMVPGPTVTAVLRKMVEAATPGVIYQDGHVAAAYLRHLDLEPANQPERVSEGVRTAAEGLPRIEAALPLFRWPHDVVAQNMQLMNGSLEQRLAEGGYREIGDGIFAAEGATLGDYAVVDSSDGPILLDEDVRVGPFCYLAGPVYAGPRTRVIEHAALKDAVSLGHTTKIGGEVEASVIEPYSNKQHHGFLGHSYLGSWINLGAGTCNSDLKNTYGNINMQYGSNRIATEMQFMGCIMGDYTKTAINTGIFTGKVIGVCSMLYGFVTSNVPSFMNYARLFGQTAELPPDVMVATQQRMFARRKVTQRQCDQELIRDMHRLTEQEREGQLGAL